MSKNAQEVLQIYTSFITECECNIQPKPFLKWAGGKSQLLSKIDELLPAVN